MYVGGPILSPSFPFFSASFPTQTKRKQPLSISRPPKSENAASEPGKELKRILHSKGMRAASPMLDPTSSSASPPVPSSAEERGPKRPYQIPTRSMKIDLALQVTEAAFKDMLQPKNVRNSEDGGLPAPEERGRSPPSSYPPPPPPMMMGLPGAGSVKSPRQSALSADGRRGSASPSRPRGSANPQHDYASSSPNTRKNSVVTAGTQLAQMQARRNSHTRAQQHQTPPPPQDSANAFILQHYEGPTHHHHAAWQEQGRGEHVASPSKASGSPRAAASRSPPASARFPAWRNVDGSSLFNSIVTKSFKDLHGDNVYFKPGEVELSKAGLIRDHRHTDSTLPSPTRAQYASRGNSPRGSAALPPLVVSRNPNTPSRLAGVAPGVASSLGQVNSPRSSAISHQPYVVNTPLGPEKTLRNPAAGTAEPAPGTGALGLRKMGPH